MRLFPWSSSDFELSRRDRLIVLYLLTIVSVVVLYTVIYNYGMRALEGESYSIFHSFQTVVETMTTTGYGADSPWKTPVMNGFMVFMQLSGIAIGFFTLRLIVIPLFTDAEVNLDNRLTRKQDHVIICEYRRDSAVLLDELEKLGIDYVLISSSRDNAEALSDDGYSVIHGSPQDESAFERASIDSARAVITDAGGANVNTILTVRTIDQSIEVITLTDDSDMRDVLLETGADTVLSPHGILGHRLAEKAVSSFSSELTDTIGLGGEIEVTEVPIQPGNRLIDTEIRNANIREATGANIIGAWIDGELQLPPDPNAVISSNTVLLVSGAHEALETFSDFVQPGRELSRPKRIVIAGMGEVGQAAYDVVTEAGVDVVTVDIDAGDDVDIVGDAGTRAILKSGGVESAGAIIIGLPNDSDSLLTTVLTRSLNPDIEILTRVSESDSTRKALRAGADYVLSVPRVSARMIAKELRGEDVLEPASQIRLLRVPATPLAGSTLAESRIYETTGCRVIAIEDDGTLTSKIDPNNRFSGDERIVLVGSDEAVQEFETQYDVTPIGGAM